MHTRVKREFGPYTLTRRHAIGGMSMVFEAHDNTLDREVALKILSEEFSADERRITAFEEEARITASFSHPNVVRVLTTGRAFGRFYIAMEMVRGGHFEHQIRERGKIPEAELLQLAIEVAQGLKAAHSAGLIHRDVKPGNILLDADGHAKLVDFGLALVTQGGMARASELWATPYYVPPETVEGQAEDFRSDVYALGATLYHALCGKPSCGEETMATDLLRQAKKKIVPLSEVEPGISEETCRIVQRAMEYDPGDRFSSYDELISALTGALGDLKAGRAETTGSFSKRRADRKRKELMVAVAGGAVLLMATGVALWWVSQPAPEPVAATPPPVVEPMVSTPVEDRSGEIARSYREARASVEAKDFENAAVQFRNLLNDPEVQEPTRTWAGLEAVLAHYLDGHSKEARAQAEETLKHMRSLPEDAPSVRGDLPRMLERLSGLPAVSSEGAAKGGASRVIAMMLAGLKNWEQGMLEAGAECFELAVSSKLPAKDGWAAVYQRFARDYLEDYAVLTGSLFEGFPTDPAGCQEAVDELDAILVTLKTRGRARFNVRAWQLDLARRAKVLKLREAAPAVVETAVEEAPQSADVLARVDELAREFNFGEMVSYLKGLPADPDGMSRAALLAVAESAAVFLTDIERDLAARPVTTDLELASGEVMAKVSIGADGVIRATSADGRSRSCKWGDFSADALIALHRLFVKNPKSETERLRRHECAIAFDWLAGNRERALGAAAILSQSSAEFEKRWGGISAGLPK